ncbi:MAG: AraC family transcriptional regulator [Puia sp.]|nr:AraC family transcriptional regulator [Puia sp.]
MQKTAVHKTEIPSSKVFVVRYLRDRHFDPYWHAHREYQLFVVLEGTGTRFIGDQIKSFRPGELVFTGPHLPHLWRSDEIYFARNSGLNAEGIVIYFDENFLGKDLHGKEEMVLLKKLLHRSARGLEFHGRCRAQVIEGMKELTDLRGMAGVIQLLRILDTLAVSREYEYISRGGFNQAYNQDETDRLNLVYDYVLKNFRRKIALTELADLLHMTQTSFSRYFTMQYSKPFTQFVSEIRIREACRLLAETDDPVSHIGYQCGFNTLSNFNKQFRDLMLKKPSQYKREYRSL